MNNGDCCESPKLTKLDDLQKKIKSVLDFVLTYCCHEKYGDDFELFLERDVDDENIQNIRIVWFSQCFRIGHTNENDDRNHESLLFEHFKNYNLCLEKKDFWWDIRISSSVDNVHRFSVIHL